MKKTEYQGGDARPREATLSHGVPMVANRLTIVALLLALAIPTSAHAAPDFDALLDLVPSRAGGVVAVDHQRLSRHAAAGKLRNFVHDQGGARGLQAVVAIGAVPGTVIHRSVSFNVGGAHGDLLSGPLDAAALEKRASAKLGARFEAGEVSGKRWFTVARGRRMLMLAEELAFVGSEKMLQRVLKRVAGKGKPVTKRSAFKSMRAPATRAKAALWGMGWISKSAREQLRSKGGADLASITRVRFHVVGDAAMTVHGEAFTGSAEEATAAKAGMERRLAAALEGSLTFKMLGVTALASALSLKTRGKVVTATLPMNAAQVDLVAQTGGKVIAILRSKSR